MYFSSWNQVSLFLDSCFIGVGAVLFHVKSIQIGNEKVSGLPNIKSEQKHFFDQKFGAIDSEVWFGQNRKFIFRVS